MKQNSSFMITPEEALALSSRNTHSVIEQAMDIARTYMKRPHYHEIFMFAALYQAGMIDGIRRERARRKEQAPLSRSTPHGDRWPSVRHSFTGTA